MQEASSGAVALRFVLLITLLLPTAMLRLSSLPKVAKIQAILDHYFPDPPIPLNHQSPFQLLCAVVLSAQTTDGKVNQVTEELFKIAPTADALARLDDKKVLAIIQPVGLAPKKSKYLVGMSQKIISDYNGELPSTIDELTTLPGVGRKTASVILSQVFGQPSLAVDTHVHRLSLRWGLSAEKTNVDKVQRDLCATFPEDTWNKVHLQMIYFGREFCTAKNHVVRYLYCMHGIHKHDFAPIIDIDGRTYIQLNYSISIQAIECPICSWVNKTSVKDQDDFNASVFTPKKRSKGIVFYSDRKDELSQNPSLSSTPMTPLAIDLDDALHTSASATRKDMSKRASSSADLPINDENLSRGKSKVKTTRSRHFDKIKPEGSLTAVKREKDQTPVSAPATPSAQPTLSPSHSHASPRALRGSKRIKAEKASCEEDKKTPAKRARISRSRSSKDET
jgi:endonuclease-3